MNIPDNIKTVSEIVKDLKYIVESQFSFVVIKGEVTNLKTSFSGHTYFTLKDKDAQIRCALFKNQKMAVKRNLEEDKEFLIWGKISVYEEKADVTVIVSFFLPFGEGEDALKLKMLKEKLSKEGVFDEKHKKQLPEFVSHIGVVTSETGAAIHDIIRVSRNRFPGMKITLCPALVQGEKAAASIIHGIEKLTLIDSIDAIIVGRGGGSKEDLSVFNSELIAYAVIKSSKPVVSAVGHETDKTVLDLAASFAVSTPSAAAELLSIDAAEKIAEISANTLFIKKSIDNIIQKQWMRFDRMMLKFPDLKQWIKEKNFKVENMMSKAEKEINKKLKKYLEQFNEINMQLELKSPLRPLENGYALIKSSGKVVKQLKQFNNIENFSIKFKDGESEIIKK